METIVRREMSRRPWMLAFLIFAVLALLATRGTARGRPAFTLADHPAEVGLSVMTYNIEGLPWPVRFGRAEAMAAIGDRLATMRAAGRQPRVVLLQEAFSDDARAIRTTTGYRYAAFGPADSAAGAEAVKPEDRRFQDEGSFFTGERSGKLVGSGLLILSDYPIRVVKSAPFPAYACAGYDCLANKGMVLAELALPDGGRVAIIDLHLNSKGASGVSGERADAAFERQTEALAAFVAANRVDGVPMVVAGDFNIGQRPDRLAMVRAALGAATPDVLSLCADRQAGCAGGLPVDADASRRRAKDWQFLLPSGGGELRVRRIAVPFGREADGTMLSDHIGYAAYLELAGQSRQPAPRNPA